MGALFLILFVLLFINYKDTHLEAGVNHYDPDEMVIQGGNYVYGDYSAASSEGKGLSAGAASKDKGGSGSMGKSLKGFDPKVH